MKQTLPITNFFATEEELKLEAVVEYAPFSGPDHIKIVIEPLRWYIPETFLVRERERLRPMNEAVLECMLEAAATDRTRIRFDRTIPIFKGDRINIYFRHYPQLKSEFDFPDAIELLDEKGDIKALYVSSNTITF